MSLYARLAAALLVAALVAAALWKHSLMVEAVREEGRAEIRAQVELRDAREAEDDAKERARRAERQQESLNAHIQAAQAAAADAARARRAAGELRDHVADLEHLAAGLAGAATDVERAAAVAATRMLADLQRRADERAGILADYADRARLAGQLCEQQYDALSAKP